MIDQEQLDGVIRESVDAANENDERDNDEGDEETVSEFRNKFNGDEMLIEYWKSEVVRKKKSIETLEKWIKEDEILLEAKRLTSSRD